MSEKSNNIKELEYYYTLYKRAFEIACTLITTPYQCYPEESYNDVRDRLLEMAKEELTSVNSPNK
jgi:hypothetical protein